VAEILNNEVFIGLCKDLIGAKISNFHLIRYVTPDGNLESSDIELELLFEDDLLLRLATAPDGERVTIHNKPWTDPFEEPISNENQQYILEHGKWSLFDVSKQPPFSRIVSKSISNLEGLQNQFGVLSGIEITCEDEVVCFCVDGDEGKLFWGKDNPEIIAYGFSRVALAQA